MESASRARLLTLDQVSTDLCLDADKVLHLVATGQLPQIYIEGQRRFDARDVAQLIRFYKAVQTRSRYEQS